MQLHDLKTQAKLRVAQLRMTAAAEAQGLLSKIDAAQRGLDGLEALVLDMRSHMLGLLESRRQEKTQVEQHMVPRRDLLDAHEEVAKLRAVMDGLSSRLQARDEEVARLQGTLQVWRVVWLLV